MSHTQPVPSPRRERAVISLSHGANLGRELTACDHEDAEVYARLNRNEDLIEYRHAMREASDA